MCFLTFLRTPRTKHLLLRPFSDKLSPGAFFSAKNCRPGHWELCIVQTGKMCIVQARKMCIVQTGKMCIVQTATHPSMKESTPGGGAKRRPPVWRRREAPPPSWMGVWLWPRLRLRLRLGLWLSAQCTSSLSARCTSSRGTLSAQNCRPEHFERKKLSPGSLWVQKAVPRGTLSVKKRCPGHFEQLI